MRAAKDQNQTNAKPGNAWRRRGQPTAIIVAREAAQIMTAWRIQCTPPKESRSRLHFLVEHPRLFDLTNAVLR
jgi:hypothetical protein